MINLFTAPMNLNSVVILSSSSLILLIFFVIILVIIRRKNLLCCKGKKESNIRKFKPLSITEKLVKKERTKEGNKFVKGDSKLSLVKETVTSPTSTV